MNDIITVCGIVATEPRHLVTDTGIAITSMRLASPSRRWDRATSTWASGATNWYTVTAFRSLAANVHKSVKKGDRIVVTGRVRIRTWERDGRGGTSVEVDAEALGHDLAWGISNWIRVPRHANDSPTAPGFGAGTPSVDQRTGEVTESAPAHPDPVQGALHEHEVGHHDEFEPDLHPDVLATVRGVTGARAPFPEAPGASDFVLPTDGFDGGASGADSADGADASPGAESHDADHSAAA